jgi:hypothetical protein
MKKSDIFLIITSLRKILIGASESFHCYHSTECYYSKIFFNSFINYLDYFRMSLATRLFQKERPGIQPGMVDALPQREVCVCDDGGTV